MPKSREGGLPRRLARAFRAIVFDWDGTAVADRREDAGELAGLAGELMAQDVWLVVLTGTNFGNVERQFCRLVEPSLRHHLIVCTNRGSEVYGFSARGEPILRFRREATEAENRKLDRVAEAVGARLAGTTGLEPHIIYDRLNRRKIDLIPLPAWEDPPKSRIGALLAAVQERLRRGGLQDGLGEVIEWTRAAAAEADLADARITSDVKHVEVGLTDKSDSVRWLAESIFEPRGIAPGDVLVAGDEFGPVAGFPGSDSLVSGALPGAVAVSVGPEPGGAPAGVIHLGGGAPRFRSLLADQLKRARRGLRARPHRIDRLPAPGADAAWRLREDGYEPAFEHEIESRFSLGNGFIGIRGSLDVPSTASRPRTYVAGLFDQRAEEPRVRALVPAPPAFPLRLSLDGEALAIDRGMLLSHSRTLDLRRGVLFSEWCHQLEETTVTLRSLRLASQSERGLALQLLQLQPDVPALLSIDRPERLDGASRAPAGAGGRVFLTGDGSLAAARLERVRLEADGRRVPVPDVGGRVHAVVERRASLLQLTAYGLGGRPEEATAAAQRALRAGARAGFRRLYARHVRQWRRRWQASDVAVEGDEEAQRALRFAVYHLNGAVDPRSERVSIAARGLTGDGYMGHVFWDTDVFMLPFFVFTWPEAARSLLLYRHRTLPAAREKARRLGLSGALYAWESTDRGEEATPPYVLGPRREVIAIRNGEQEVHISADVAYAVWQYWRATGDAAFLRDAGAEIILETSRFWSSRCHRGEDGLFHIRSVIGPDEYHEGVDDNAYTNYMARWNIERGLEAARLLKNRWPQRWRFLSAELALTEAEIEHWASVCRSLYVPFSERAGLLEQFAGYFDLDYVDLAAYATRAAPMDVLLGRERTSRSQVIKQADVVMLLALIPEAFDARTRRDSFSYYESRCGHGSSLSPPVHAWVAARLGMVDLAESYFREAAAIDLNDSMGNSAAGLHMGALGGLWQAAVFGFGGMALREDGLAFEPRLPRSWRGLRFRVQWRGRRLKVAVSDQGRTLAVELEKGRPMRVYAAGRTHRLQRGGPLLVSLAEAERTMA